MKDGGQKSEILPFATLFGTHILLHIECTGRKLVITDRTTPKCIRITIRTLADAKSRHLLSQQDLSYLDSMIVTFIPQTNTMSL